MLKYVLVLALTVMLAAGCGGVTTRTGASTSAYPTKTVTLVSEHAAGGAIDTGARLLQPFLQKQLGVPVLVEDKVGAGGNVGRQYVYNARPSGYTLLMTLEPSMAMGQLLNNGSFQTTRFTPIYGVYGGSSSVIIARKSGPYASIAALQHARRPVTVAVAGVGNDSWLAVVYLHTLLKVPVQIVPFNGGAQVIAAVLGGSVQLASTSSSPAYRAVKAGQPLKVLVQFGPSRMSDFPKTPTIGQLGHPDGAFSEVLGVYGPPGVPTAVVGRLAAAMKRATADPAFLAKAKQSGETVQPLAPKAFAKVIRVDYGNIQSHLSVLKQALSSSSEPSTKKKG